MPDYIGNIPVPSPAPSGVFPLAPDYPATVSREPQIAVHVFANSDANLKIEQRFYLGNGARRWTVRKARLRDSDRQALRNFWEERNGPYQPFTFNAPNDDLTATTPVTVCFDNAPLSWEMLGDFVCTLGVTLVEVLPASPTYPLVSTQARFPSSALQAALLSQVQEVVPLVKIQPNTPGYSAIYLSDRRCTVGDQLYLARLLRWDGITQSLNGESDEARFVLGNADRAMTALANDVALKRARVEFSLFHVGQSIKLDLWAGEVTGWTADQGPEFGLTAADGIYEVTLPYPVGKVSRTCWRPFNNAASGCPFAAEGSLDLVHFPSATAATCDKNYDTPNGCLAHGMKRHFGGVLAKPQGVNIKDNSTGTWGLGRRGITSTSIVSDTIYNSPLQEIWHNQDGDAGKSMPVSCALAAGREESDFYDALGVVGAGPIGAFTESQMYTDSNGVTRFIGHLLDGQPHHGWSGNSLGLRAVLGNDPANSGDCFSLGRVGTAPGNWREAAFASSVYDDNYSAGVAFLELRRTDAKGIQPSRLIEHLMTAQVAAGLAGFYWTGSGPYTRGLAAGMTDPFWIAINALLRARGMRNASDALQQTLFDVAAVQAANAVSQATVDRIIGIGQETQFRFKGVIAESKPLRDWLQEILNNALGFYTFSFGRLKVGARANASAVEAFTIGNILRDSLRLAPVKATFNHLTAEFADEEFAFQKNSVELYDIDHATLSGGGAGPLFLKSNLNLVGTATKSQAARITTTRLREELGGVTAAEQNAAREIAFKTTVLALNVEPGMVCSLTHPDMPGGYGKFRVTGWKLNPDYSIEIAGRSVTDSMYDMTVGDKPADVKADSVPGELVLQVQPGDVAIGTITVTPAPAHQDGSPQVDLAIPYTAPSPLGSFTGVNIWIEEPDQSGTATPAALGSTFVLGSTYLTPSFQPIDMGTFPYDSSSPAIIVRMRAPIEQQTWRVYAGSMSAVMRNPLVRATLPDPTPSAIVIVNPVPAGVEGQEYAPLCSGLVGAGPGGNPLEYRRVASGDQVFRIRLRWTLPTRSGYGGCDIERVDMRDARTLQASESPQVNEWASLWAMVPPDPETYRLELVSFNQAGHRNTPVRGVTPSLPVTVQLQSGPAGAEKSPNVDNFAWSAGYTVNGRGQQILAIDATWTDRSDPEFGGVILFAITPGTEGRTPYPGIQLTGILTGGLGRVEISDFPQVSESWKIYALAVDSNNNANSYLDGTTPAQTRTVPPPPFGSVGQEYTSNVTSFAVTVTPGAQANADGTYRSRVRCTFVKPGDPTWGGVDIEVEEPNGSGNWTTRFAAAADSPVTFYIDTPSTVAAWRFAAVGFDVNGQKNSWPAGVPTVVANVGDTAGRLDIRKTAATTIDGTVEITGPGGVFRARSIKLNYNGITTEITNEAGYGGFVGTSIKDNAAGEQIILQPQTVYMLGAGPVILLGGLDIFASGMTTAMYRGGLVLSKVGAGQAVIEVNPFDGAGRCYFADNTGNQRVAIEGSVGGIDLRDAARTVISLSAQAGTIVISSPTKAVILDATAGSVYAYQYTVPGHVGASADLSYLKPNGTTGFLTFVGGICTNAF